jgi:hypothetical protein
MTIEEIVRGLRTNRIRRPDFGGDEALGVDPMVFESSLAESGAAAEECDAAAGGHCPDDLTRFWQLARSGKLFEDITSGQCGLEILSPDEAVAATEEYQTNWVKDAAKGDLIVGQFIGDTEQLLVRTDPEATDFGTVVVVAEMIDPRADWDIAAESFGEFLNRYVEARGDKYWTQTGMNVQETIAKLKTEWQPGQIQRPVGDGAPMVMGCEFPDEGAGEFELMSTLGFGIPLHLLEFWRTARWGRLWNLEMLTPTDAAAETRLQRQARPKEYKRGDLVAGRFLRESNLLVIPCDEADPDFGAVLVADPIAPRQDWCTVSDSFGDFLARYVEAEGEKYWEADLQE